MQGYERLCLSVFNLPAVAVCFSRKDTNENCENSGDAHKISYFRLRPKCDVNAIRNTSIDFLQIFSINYYELSPYLLIYNYFISLL
jgi:hypothetical protein